VENKIQKNDYLKWGKQNVCSIFLFLKKDRFIAYHTIQKAWKPVEPI